MLLPMKIKTVTGCWSVMSLGSKSLIVNFKKRLKINKQLDWCVPISSSLDHFMSSL